MCQRYENLPAKIILPNKPDVQKFWGTRLVLFATEKKVEMELDRLEKWGVIERIPNDISEFIFLPIAVVAKRNTNSICICGDFKVTVNQMLAVEKYPLPSAEELFAKVGNSQHFAKLDLEKVYHQVELE